MDAQITAGEVIRLEGVDVPEGAQFYTLKHDAINLRVMIAPAIGGESRGSIVFHPGRTEFIEKFFETISDLQKRRFTVFMLDPRGQGLSTRALDDPMKSYIKRFDDYADDFEFAVRTFKNDLPKPHIVMGHSMGGTVGLQTILSGKLNPAACVFTAPMLELQDIDSPFMDNIIRFLSWAGLSQSYLPFQAQRTGVPVSFEYNKLTSDPNRYQLWARYFETTARLRVGAPTYGWVSAAISSMKFVNGNAEHLKIPGLIIACGGDPIVTPQSNIEFAQNAGIDWVNILGAKHEILLESDEYRDQFWVAFDEFLAKNGF